MSMSMRMMIAIPFRYACTSKWTRVLFGVYCDKSRDAYDVRVSRCFVLTPTGTTECTLYWYWSAAGPESVFAYLVGLVVVLVLVRTWQYEYQVVSGHTTVVLLVTSGQENRTSYDQKETVILN